MSRRFENKTVVITGASAGIGAAAARAFALEGANLVLAARGQAALDRIVEEIDGTMGMGTGTARAVATDVADLDACQALLQRAAAEFGAIHVLVNNAGFNCRGLVEEHPAEDLARVVDVNLRAPVALSRMVLPYLHEAGGGAIVNVASIAGRVPLAHEAVYSATKFGLRAFSFALAEELEGSGISVSAVSPGPVDTQFLMGELDSVPDVVFAQPMSTSEEIALLILEAAAAGGRELVRPRVTGYLATLGYLVPGLSRVLQPVMARRGRKVKEQYRAARPDKSAGKQPDREP